MKEGETPSVCVCSTCLERVNWDEHRNSGKWDGALGKLQRQCSLAIALHARVHEAEPLCLRPGPVWVSRAGPWTAQAPRFTLGPCELLLHLKDQRCVLIGFDSW